MAWRLRTACCLVVAALLVSAWTPVEARHVSGGGRPNPCSTARGHGGTGSDKPPTQRNHSSAEDFWKTVTRKNKGRHKTTEVTPITTTHRHRHGHGTRHLNNSSHVTQQWSVHTKSVATKQNAAGSHNRSRYHGPLTTTPKTRFQPTTSSGLRNKPVTAVTGKRHQQPKTTTATPITMTNISWYGYGQKNRTKPTDPKRNATSTFKTTQRPPTTNAKPPPFKNNSNGSNNNSRAVLPTSATVPKHTNTSKTLPSTPHPNSYSASPVTKKNSSSSHNSPHRIEPSLATPKPGYDGILQTTPKAKVQHTTSSGSRNKSVEVVTGNNYQHPERTIATLITTPNNSWYGYGHKSHTKPTDSKHTTTNNFKTTQRPPITEAKPPASKKNSTVSKNSSSAVLHATPAVPKHTNISKILPSTQRPNIYPTSTVTNKNSTSSHNSSHRVQPSLPTPKSGYDGSLKATLKNDVQQTTSSGHRNKSVEAVTGKNYQHPETTIATPTTTPNNGWYGYGHKNHSKPTGPKHTTTSNFNTTQRPPVTTVTPPASKKNATSLRNSTTAFFPVTTPMTPKQTNMSKVLSSTQRPNIYVTSAVTEKVSTSSHNIPPGGHSSLPTSKPGGTKSQTPPPYNPNTVKQGKPVNNSVLPPTYPGYPGSPSHQTSSGPRWKPPGYVPITSVIPGFNVSLSIQDGLKYLKNFFNQSSPTVVFQLQQYHYPSNIPSEGTRGCDCYVKGLTAACISKLKDKRIPSCVNSSVTSLFIKSKEVDELSIDAFSKVKHLKYINITATALTLLPRDFFRDTKQLLHLVVQKNPKLKSLHPDAFRDAYKLEDVILDRNSISSLDRDVFTNLTNVKRLNLGYNKIRSLPKGIFRDNRELEELRLSGNALHISSDTARDLLKNNAKLRVLLMRSCKLDDLPTGLLRNASNLEWLDLSHNNISKFPAEFIKDCAKLSYLRLSYNNLTVLSSDVLYQHSGSLSTLRLEANPWRCDCSLVPLASWATLRNESVPVQPRCSSPLSVRIKPLPRWLHSRHAAKCAAAASPLRTELNRVLSVARAIAQKGPHFSTNLLKVSDEEVSLIATNYFLYTMAAKTDIDIGSLMWHWARFLEEVLDRRHLRYSDAKMGTNSTSLGWTAPAHKNISEENLHFDFGTRVGPLATTTTTATGIQQPLRPKGFELLVNFTNIMKNLPKNVTKVVDDGIEEELKVLFGVAKGTNTTGPDAMTGFRLSTAPTSGIPVPLMKLNATELVAVLRSELRELLSILLQSIDRANWDAAYQKYVEEEEKGPKTSLKPPHVSGSQTATSTDSSAESCMLLQPQLTVRFALLSLLAHTLV